MFLVKLKKDVSTRKTNSGSLIRLEGNKTYKVNESLYHELLNLDAIDLKHLKQKSFNPVQENKKANPISETPKRRGRPRKVISDQELKEMNDLLNEEQSETSIGSTNGSQ